jgi:hypothetical protein
MVLNIKYIDCNLGSLFTFLLIESKKPKIYFNEKEKNEINAYYYFGLIKENKLHLVQKFN